MTRIQDTTGTPDSVRPEPVPVRAEPDEAFRQAQGERIEGGDSEETPLLDVQDLRIAFAGHEVVHGVNFKIQPGERVALVGESGSGKTVTALSVLCLLQDASISGQAVFSHLQDVRGWECGVIATDPVQVDLVHATDAQIRGIRGRDIAMIFQEPMTALNPLMTINRQILEVIEEKQNIPRILRQQLAIDLISKTGIKDAKNKINSYPHQLSGGQRQRAMIAMALACKPKLLLADEPTTALDVTVRAQILDLILELQKSDGMAVLLITHDLNMVRRFAQRVIVMENGHIVEQGPVADVFDHPQHAYTKKLLDSKAPRNVVERVPLKGDGEVEGVVPLLTAKQLRVNYPTPLPGIKGWFKKGQFTAVQGVDFALLPGQTLGVIGESGSGKSTLALAALGLLPLEGELQLKGQSWSLQNATPGATRVAKLAMRKTMQVVFQDPFSSLSPRMTVEEIVGEGLLVHQKQISKLERSVAVTRALEAVGMAENQFPNLLGRYPHEFSGGQRQRIAIARALIVEPQILVLDEPTSALDVTIQKQVIELLQQLQRDRGLSYLLITHDVSVIQAMAHHVLVMRDARIVEAGTVNEVLGAPKEAYTRTLLAAAG